MKLVIGNRNYSSWSLRAWLYMTESGLDFEEIRLPLFEARWPESIARYSPAGRVPVLIDGDVCVWDSLAIIGYLRETRAGAVGWPEDRLARAYARSVVAEMHSGFLALRDELPQNIRKREVLSLDGLSSACRGQVRRIEQMWVDCSRFDGPWLFGDFSIADVFFAPVALRFRTYGIEVAPEAAAFMAQVEGLAAIQRWSRAAADEAESLDFIDERKPAAGSPLVLG